MTYVNHKISYRVLKSSIAKTSSNTIAAAATKNVRGVIIHLPRFSILQRA